MNNTKEILDRFLNRRVNFTFYGYSTNKKYNYRLDGLLIKKGIYYYLLHNDQEFNGAQPENYTCSKLNKEFGFNYSYSLNSNGAGYGKLITTFKPIERYNKRIIKVTI